MKREEIRQRLIEGTIRVIALEGLDGATTKRIGCETQLNEAYIYRCFDDKEHLFAGAFAALDEELAAQCMKHVAVMYDTGLPFDTRCWLFFSGVWRFLLGGRDKCIAFLRYYYSPYFERFSAQEHRVRFEPLCEKFSAAFRPEANVWMLLIHILNVMLDFVLKVFDGYVPDNDDTAEHVFRLLYVSVKQYFKTEEENIPNEKSMEHH